MHFLNLLHTMSIYANRWGGPRYRTEELAKFLHKHVYNVQEEQLKTNKKINICLAIDAFLNSRHKPSYLKSVQMEPELHPTWTITDELGYTAVFHEGTEILLYKNDALVYEKIENIQIGDRRVINFELVEEFNNDKLHHHSKFSENFLTIKCKDFSEIEMAMCDALTSMTIVQRAGLEMTKLDQFNRSNDQELYLVDIIGIVKCIPQTKLNIEIMPFSYSLHKNRELSDKSEKRYYKSRQSTVAKRYLEKMRSKVFSMKKDNVKVELELKHVED
jgi:hypothetical protein